MIRAIELIEIQLDKPRHMLLNHSALCRAEREVNRLRNAAPETYAAIDFLMVDAFNRMFRSTGLLPLDLLMIMLWAALLHEEPGLTVDRVAELLDTAPVSRMDVSAVVWKAYFSMAGKNLQEVPPGEDPPQRPPDPRPGSANGASGGSN